MRKEPDAAYLVSESVHIKQLTAIYADCTSLSVITRLVMRKAMT